MTTTTETAEQATDDQSVIAEAERITAEKAERIAEAKQVDEDLRSAARQAADSLAMVGMLIKQAEELGVWRLVTDAQGKSYKSHHGYITDVLSAEMGPLAPANRNALVKVCLDNGLSQRAAAQIAKTSPAVANRVAKGEKPGERKPRQKREQPTPPQQRRSLSTRVFEFLDQVSNRIDEIATSDLENLDKKLGAVHKQVQANLKLRHENSPSKAPRKQPMKRAATVTQAAKQAAKSRHPAGSKKPADAA